MNKISKLFLGVAALGLWSCSSDEPNNGGENIAKGDVAYLNVNIIATGNASRATDGGFEYGSTDENEVKNAYFYFYDGEGNFVTESNTWVNGGVNTDTPAGNIEAFGKNTIVLEGLTGKNYPNWVITVLNKPVGLTAKRTMSEMYKQLTNYRVSATDAHFVMATTSYFGSDNTGYYFATKLNTNNFSQAPTNGFPEDKGSVVDIYVERLAARVQVVANIGNTKQTIGDRTLYELPVTIAGEDNPNTGTTGTPSNVAAEKVYIELLGWELNAHAKESNLSKDFGAWTSSTTWANSTWATNGWNDATNHRSYWGQSTTYGLKDEALKAKLHTAENNWYHLDNTIGVGGVASTKAYCNETTNEIGNITTTNGTTVVAKPNSTPTVLLKARICDAAGNGLDIVNFLGINFIKDGFLRKALDIKKSYVENFYYKKAVGGTDYFFHIDESCLALVKDENGTGSVDVQIAEGTTLYTVTNPTLAGTEGGKEYFTVESSTAVTTSNVNDQLKQVTEGTNNKAIAYTSGAAYYAIPLEHVNKATTGTAAVEGQYGVVRNHIYNLTITKISSLGDGVFDPTEDSDEKIDPIDPKDPTYYVESKINILSWKIVNQNAEI